MLPPPSPPPGPTQQVPLPNQQPMTALPPGLGPVQGAPQAPGGIPLLQMMPQLEQMLRQPVSPKPLTMDANTSSGVTVDRSTIADPSKEDDGLPGHRLLEMYNGWSMFKRTELLNQLKYEQMYHGYQWTDEQLEVLKDRAQPPTYFNELRKKIDSYIGIEQRLRRDPKAQPRTPKHEGDCDAATAALREVADTTNSQLKYSEAGRDFFVRGVGGLWQGIENTFDGKIAITKRRVPGYAMIYDPRSMEWDFADAKFLGEWGLVDVEDARDMFDALGRPDSAEKVEMLIGNMGSGTSTGLPGEWSRLHGDWFNRSLARIRLVHMYYRYKRQWRCAYLCGYIKLYDAPSIYRDENGNSVQPFNFVSCHVDDRGERYGVAKDLIPIQEAINVRASKLTWLISARQMIFEEGAVDDPNLAREQFKRPDGMIKLKPNGLAKVKIEAMQAEIAGQAELLKNSVEMMHNYGPNPALLGKNSGEESGRAILARQNAGMTEMSPVFERHREFKLKAFKRDWQLVRQFWTSEKWVRTTDDDKGVKFVPLNQVVVDQQRLQALFQQVQASGQPINPQAIIPLALKYAVRKNNDVASMDIDIIIDEGPDVITMNEELMDLLGKLGQAATSPIGRIMIELSNVRNKDRLIKLLDDAQPKPNPEQQDYISKKNFLEIAQAAAKVDDTLATVEGKRAKTLLDLTAGAIPSDAMQVFPFEYGAPTTYEDLLGQQLHPAGNPNAFVPQPPMGGMDQMMGMPPAPGGHVQAGMPPFPQTPQHRPIGGLTPPPVLPNQEPKMGQPGGLPLPPSPSTNAQALMPPGNTRI